MFWHYWVHFKKKGANFPNLRHPHNTLTTTALPKSDFQSQFLMSRVKNHMSFYDFFFIQKYQFIFLITSIFDMIYFLKWCLIFDSSESSQNAIISSVYILANLILYKYLFFGNFTTHVIIDRGPMGREEAKIILKTCDVVYERYLL